MFTQVAFMARSKWLSFNLGTKKVSSCHNILKHAGSLSSPAQSLQHVNVLQLRAFTFTFFPPCMLPNRQLENQHFHWLSDLHRVGGPIRDSPLIIFLIMLEIRRDFLVGDWRISWERIVRAGTLVLGRSLPSILRDKT